MASPAGLGANVVVAPEPGVANEPSGGGGGNANMAPFIMYDSYGFPKIGLKGGGMDSPSPQPERQAVEPKVETENASEETTQKAEQVELKKEEIEIEPTEPVQEVELFIVKEEDILPVETEFLSIETAVEELVEVKTEPVEEVQVIVEQQEEPSDPLESTAVLIELKKEPEPPEDSDPLEPSIVPAGGPSDPLEPINPSTEQKKELCDPLETTSVPKECSSVDDDPSPIFSPTPNILNALIVEKEEEIGTTEVIKLEDPLAIPVTETTMQPLEDSDPLEPSIIPAGGPSDPLEPTNPSTEQKKELCDPLETPSVPKECSSVDDDPSPIFSPTPNILNTLIVEKEEEIGTTEVIKLEDPLAIPVTETTVQPPEQSPVVSTNFSQEPSGGSSEEATFTLSQQQLQQVSY